MPLKRLVIGNTKSFIMAKTLATVEDDITPLKTSVSEGKALIAAAVTDKGVETAADDTFATMAGNIRDIPSIDIKTYAEDSYAYVRGPIKSGDFIGYRRTRALNEIGDTLYNVYQNFFMIGKFIILIYADRDDGGIDYYTYEHSLDNDSPYKVVSNGFLSGGGGKVSYIYQYKEDVIVILREKDIVSIKLNANTGIPTVVSKITTGYTDRYYSCRYCEVIDNIMYVVYLQGDNFTGSYSPCIVTLSYNFSDDGTIGNRIVSSILYINNIFDDVNVNYEYSQFIDISAVVDQNKNIIFAAHYPTNESGGDFYIQLVKYRVQGSSLSSMNAKTIPQYVGSGSRTIKFSKYNYRTSCNFSTGELGFVIGDDSANRADITAYIFKNTTTTLSYNRKYNLRIYEYQCYVGSVYFDTDNNACFDCIVLAGRRLCDIAKIKNGKCYQRINIFVFDLNAYRTIKSLTTSNNPFTNSLSDDYPGIVDYSLYQYLTRRYGIPLIAENYYTHRGNLYDMVLVNSTCYEQIFGIADETIKTDEIRLIKVKRFI